MLTPFFERSFDRDIKIAQKRRLDISKLQVIISKLVEEKPIPEKNRLHKLKGKFAGCWECHISPDWLLIYTKDERNIYFLRTGSHSDLF